MYLAIMAAAAILAAADGGAGGDADATIKPAQPDRGVRVDDLMAKGFVVMRDTKIVGDFDGCDYGLEVQLAAGGTFKCSGFGYMHATNPKAVLLKSPDGQYKLVVGNAVFDGAFS